MRRIRLSIQIALSLAFLSATVLFAAKAFGLLPDQRKEAVEMRIALSESLAITSSVLANRKQWDGVNLTLRELHARNPTVISAGLRRLDDRVMADVGNHQATWRHPADRKSTETNIYVPIMQGKSRWGSLEVAFRPIGVAGWPNWIDVPLWRLVIFAVAANSLLFLFYLGRVLCELDPSRVMPQRVRSAFDTLTEGLIVLDDAGRIVLANQAFAAAMGRTPEELLGQKATSLPFQTNAAGIRRPWEEVRNRSAVHAGVEMTLPAGPNGTRTFFVNAAPIEDQKGNARGCLASFAEITQLEQQKHELLTMLDALRESRDKICQQNDELSYLATRDPLTGCLNRRSFFEQFERSWSQGNVGELSCIMTDIDLFKSINDNHGHSMGDEVLKRVAGELLAAIGSAGVICRYGGEEFCLVLASCSFDQAVETAELLRQRIAALQFTQLSVTASFGISCGGLGASSCQDLLDQADKSLYFSKRSGRNRVTRWDQVPADFQIHGHDKTPSSAAPAAEAKQPQVPYPAVACLLRALAYRDLDTACHSARVADLAVATARGLMTAGDAYLLEIAALLHDIGKIGVPDSILLKPGKLTPDEWRIMNLHASIGVEIVNSSFDSKALVDTVRYHHAFFGGTEPGLPSGCEIPLGARIVSICDAFDAMVTNRVYRPGRPPAEAFVELRRMAGVQFDPELVERFIEVVSQRQLPPPQSLVPVSKELALSLGLQSERLASALDGQDFVALRAVAMHLKSTAEAHGLAPLAEAAELLQSCSGDADAGQLVEVIHEIMSMSLAAQQCHLAVNSDLDQLAQVRSRLFASERSPLA